MYTLHKYCFFSHSVWEVSLHTKSTETGNKLTKHATSTRLLGLHTSVIFPCIIHFSV